MKKFTLGLLGAVMVMMHMVGCVEQPKTVTVSGDVPSYWHEGDSVVLLQFFTHNGTKVLGEGHVVDGKVNFATDSLTETMLLGVENARGLGYFSFVASPGENLSITFEGNKAVVTGSASHDEYVATVEQPLFELQKKISALYRENLELMERVNGPEGDIAKKSPEYKEYQRKLQALKDSNAEEAKKIVMANADKIWGALILRQSTMLQPSEEMYAAFSDEVKNSTYGKAVRAALDKMLVGKRVPAFTVKDVDGKEYSVESMMEGCDYLLIDFWASWCKPCRASIPEMKEFAVQYADKGLKIVSISTDTDNAAWVKAMEQEQMPWLQCWDSERSVSNLFHVRGIPSVHLVRCSDGVVLAENLFGEAVGVALEKHIK